MRVYYFYIIYSNLIDKFYIGHTSDIKDRLRKHNTSHKGFTGKTNDWRVVYTEELSSKELAYSKEREVKKWKSRKRIEEMIKNNSSEHPD